MIKNPEKVAEHIATFIRDQIHGAACVSAVVGISGGVDSALCAALCHRAACELVLLQMPCGEVDDVFARRSADLVRALSAQEKTVCIDIKPIYRAYLAALPEEVARDLINQGNLRARIRANILYAYARLSCGLVVGTGNLVEDGVLGYFTKYGDGAVDISPIGALYKSEVYQLARYLSVPDSILEATPSAGLWEGQTDEGELGFTYAQAEKWFRERTNTPLPERIDPGSYDPHLPEPNARIPAPIADQIERMHLVNAHKMRMPPICQVRELGADVIV